MAKASYVWDGTQWINFGTAGSIGPPASIAVGTVTTSAAGGSAVVTNVGTSSAAIFDFTLPRGNTGPTGSAATIAVGTVTTGSAGSSASVTNSGTSGIAVFDFTIPRGDTGATGATGPTGPTGTAATIAVGSVTTGSAGSSATVTNSGTSSAATFNFTIPRGDTGTTGATGAAATIAVGTVTTGSAGSSASVTNVGTSGAATFNFTIPRGDTGLTGATGAAGDKYQTTSTSTLTIATSGTLNLTIGTGLSYSVNQTILVSYDIANHMHAEIDSYNSSTGAMVAQITDADGSGTYSTWTVNLSGAVGAVGPTGPTGSTGPTGPTGAGYSGTTSTTSLAIGTGSKAFTVGSVGAFVSGQRVRASSSATPASYVEGQITSIVGSVITVNVDAIGGSGTINDWVFGIAGSLGAGAYYQATAPSSPLTGYLWVDSSQTLSTYTNVYTQAQVDALLLALQNSLSTTSDQLILANRIFS